MNKKYLFYSSAAALPVLALVIASGVHAAPNTNSIPERAQAWGQFQKIELTDAQKEAIKQAQALRAQADDILEKAGLPSHRPGPGKHFMRKLNLTDEQKAVLEQAHSLRQEGKIDEAKALLEKAGLPGIGKGKMLFKQR